MKIMELICERALSLNLASVDGLLYLQTCGDFVTLPMALAVRPTQ